MVLSCETQGQDDTLVFYCSFQGLLMKQSQAGPPCQGHCRLLIHHPMLWAAIALQTMIFSTDQLKSLELTS